MWAYELAKKEPLFAPIARALNEMNQKILNPAQKLKIKPTEKITQIIFNSPWGQIKYLYLTNIF